MTRRTADLARRSGIRDVSHPVRHKAGFANLNQSVVNNLGGECLVIVADDIGSWARATEPGERAGWFLDEMYGDIAPPWPDAWIEYPSVSGNERRAVLVRQLACLGDPEFPTPAELAANTERFQHGSPVTEAWFDATVTNGCPPDQVGWIIDLTVYVEAHGQVHGPVGVLVYVLGLDGHIVGNRWVETARGNPDVEHWLHWLLAATDVTMWTLSLVHCRNVTVEPVRPTVTPKHRRRGNLPPVRYHVLRLQLPRKQAAEHGGGDGITPGVHVVAGHRAHYGNCCPGRHEPNGLLFGKLEGIFWVPYHARGNPDNGVITTDLEPVMAEKEHADATRT